VLTYFLSRETTDIHKQNVNKQYSDSSIILDMMRVTGPSVGR